MLSSVFILYNEAQSVEKRTHVIHDLPTTNLAPFFSWNFLEQKQIEVTLKREQYVVNIWQQFHYYCYLLCFCSTFLVFWIHILFCDVLHILCLFIKWRSYLNCDCKVLFYELLRKKLYIFIISKCKSIMTFLDEFLYVSPLCRNFDDVSTFVFIFMVIWKQCWVKEWCFH